MGYEGYDDGSLGHDMLLHVITYYRIHPYTVYYQPISIVAHIQSWGSTFPPPASPWPIMALAPRWEDCRTAAAAGSPKGLQAQRPAICPCACGVSEPPKLAQPPANINLKPSWNRLIVILLVCPRASLIRCSSISWVECLHNQDQLDKRIL